MKIIRERIAIKKSTLLEQHPPTKLFEKITLPFLSVLGELWFIIAASILNKLSSVILFYA
jgi:hypothetical protein